MKNFHVGIKSIIVKQNKVLLLKRYDHSEFWDIPGGRINDNESIEQALVRELKEEVTNVKDIKIKEILSAWRLNKDILPDTSLVLIFYRVDADFGQKPELSEEHIDWKLATKSEALKLAEPSTHEAIDRAFG